MPQNARCHQDREHQRSVIEKALLMGKTTADVVAAAMSTFNVSEPTARADVAAVRERWKDDRRAELEWQFGLALARRDALYRRAIEKANAASEKGDDATATSALRLALDVERDKSQLLGLYPDGPAPVRPVAVVAVTIPDDELRAIAGDAVNHAPPPALNAPDPNHFLNG